MKKLLIIIMSMLFPLLAFAEPNEFRLNTGSPESLSNDTGDGFYNLIAAETFKRLNIKLNFIRLPSKRSLINANKGIDDGNIARIVGMEKKWPNLVRVPESIMTWEFTAFSQSNNIKLKGWESLKHYTVGHVRGWQIYEKKAAAAKKIIRANNPQQLFELLRAGRVDLALFERFQSAYWFNKIGYSANSLSPALAKKPLYIYVHKKHKDLAPKIAKTLSEIKQDGTYKNIFDRTLNFKK